MKKNKKEAIPEVPFVKKNYKGTPPMIISAFLLIFWDVWRIKGLFSSKPNVVEILTSVVMIIFFLLVAYRAFHLYIDFLSIDKKEIRIAGVLKDKVIEIKNIKSVEIKRDFFIVLNLRNEDPIQIRLKDFNKKTREDVKNTLLNIKTRKYSK